MLRLVVDLNRCQGYAQCAFLAPDVFAMHGDEGLLYDPQAEDAQRERLAQAAAACPVQAILVDDLDLNLDRNREQDRDLTAAAEARDA